MSTPPVQPDLPLVLIDKEHHDVPRLVALLHARADWVHAALILDHWQVPETEHNKRFIRALAAAAEPDIISGQRGYKHIDHATRDEVMHFAASMRSQMSKMDTRVSAVLRRFHRGRPAAPSPNETPSNPDQGRPLDYAI